MQGLKNEDKEVGIKTGIIDIDNDGKLFPTSYGLAYTYRIDLCALQNEVFQEQRKPTKEEMREMLRLSSKIYRYLCKEAGAFYEVPNS